MRPAGAYVTLCYRRSALDAAQVKPWLLPELSRLAEADRLRVLPGKTPVEIRHGSTVLRSTDEQGRPLSGPENPPLEVPTDFVLLLTGYIQDTHLLELIGIELIGPDRRPNINPQTMESNVPGVFVAGTATAGSPSGRIQVIIETCHAHVERILAAITGCSVSGLGETDPDAGAAHQDRV